MKALFCIHGILSTHHDFDFIMSRLNEKYDYIYAIDLPGHGKNKISFTVNNTLNYVTSEYDKLFKNYDTVDVIGYSLGGVLALYLQSIRKINKLILLAPALKYINLKNFDIKRHAKESSNLRLKEIIPKASNKKYLITFVYLTYYVKSNVTAVYPKTLIIWGNKDYLVKEKSGYYIFNMCRSKVKGYLIMDNINHFNIVRSNEVVDNISKFISF